MKTRVYISLFLTVGLVAGLSCPVTSAQEPSPSPTQTPATSGHKVPTFVCLKQDYVDALKSSGVIRETQITAAFIRFDGDFAVFKRPESPATVYIPKDAILYISANTQAPIKY